MEVLNVHERVLAADPVMTLQTSGTSPSCRACCRWTSYAIGARGCVGTIPHSVIGYP